MKQNKPCISLIIPVYNESEKSLIRAVDSALSQSSVLKEILVIDDGSDFFPDLEKHCPEAFASGRIRVIHQENAGVSAARNRGLEEAEGKWIGFLDADDCLADSYAGELCGFLQEDADLILFDAAAERETDAGHVTPVRLIPDAEEGLLGTEDVRLFCLDVLADGYEERQGRLYLQAVGNKLFRSSRIRSLGLRFPEDMKIGEDCAFLLRYLFGGDLRATYLPRPLYIRTIREGSAMHKRHPDIRANDRAFLREIRRAVQGRLNEKGIRSALLKRCAVCALGVLQYDTAHPEHPGSAGERVREMREFLGETPYRQAVAEADLRWFSRKNRLRIFLLRHKCCRLFLLAARRLT